jgi:branched-subunit amino acid transport protein
MNTSTLWLAIIGMGIITYGIRAASLLLADKLPDSRWLQSFLRFVPISVLSALIFQDVFSPNSTLDLSPLSNPRLIAALLAVLVAWRAKKSLPTIAVGMLALWLLQWLLGAKIIN